MSIIAVTPEAEATDPVSEFYAGDVREQGYVASHTKVMSVNPEALVAWRELVRALSGPMGKRRFELVTLAASLGVRSRHCRLAHGRKSLPLFDEDELIRIARDYHDAGLSEAEVAMMEFAEKVSRASDTMTDADSLRLRSLGFSDREIVDIALTAAARNYYSRAIQALAVDVDEFPELSEDLRAALLEPLAR
jgi:uncharacterized peroxidase-related enzyme